MRRQNQLQKDKDSAKDKHKTAGIYQDGNCNIMEWYAEADKGRKDQTGQGHVQTQRKQKHM